MQQRVALARAIARRPEMLIMDEPFAAVDAQPRADLEDLVRDPHRNRGISTVFVTHDIDESVYLGRHIGWSWWCPSAAIGRWRGSRRR
ncbi:ATP-binding cassette domain-containing protein [Micromonospora sp. WMMD998]|uniref:ATP-binding cassette domain-containing protein n=1 Tax=Micromonospora sp. WMMD998 TaxID=3016092 RepID=UPI00249BEFFC|nr:ATP-binding cassette domain-containing protein [Micromonospora sp. WMMD998]WFE41116.1 hypothetical protein O7619_22685 [Micromonospora sp. WMMD998]